MTSVKYLQVIRFTSLIVQIKPITASQTSLKLNVFTSLIVQIKRAKCAEFEKKRISFTSLIVQIKLLNILRRTIYKIIVYIPHSSDKTKNSFIMDKTKESVYIPHSSDKTYFS